MKLDDVSLGMRRENMYRIRQSTHKSEQILINSGTGAMRCDEVNKASTINFDARQLSLHVNIISGFHFLLHGTNDALALTSGQISIAFQSNNNKFIPNDLMIRLLIVLNASTNSIK